MGFAMMMGSGSSFGTEFARVRIPNPWSHELRFANNCIGAAIYGGGLTQTLKMIGDCSKSKKMLKPVRCQVDESSGDLARAKQDFNDAAAAFWRAAKKINRKRFDTPEFIAYKDEASETMLLQELFDRLENARTRLEALRNKEPIAVQTIASSQSNRSVVQKIMDDLWLAVEIVQDATKKLSLAESRLRVIMDKVQAAGHDVLECREELIETKYWLEGYERWWRDAVDDINEAEAELHEFVQKTIEDRNTRSSEIRLEKSWGEMKFSVQQVIEGSRDDIDEVNDAGARLEESIKKTMEDRNIRSSGLEKSLDKLKFAVQQLVEVRASYRLTLEATEESRALKVKAYFTAFNVLKEDPHLVQDSIAEACAAGEYVQKAIFGLSTAGEELKVVMKSVESEDDILWKVVMKSVEAEDDILCEVAEDGDTCEEREH